MTKHSPDVGPPLPLKPWRLGMICKLAERPCPLDGFDDLDGRSGRLAWLPTSSVRASLAPMDIMDTERLCVFPSLSVLDAPPFHVLEAVCDCDRTEAVGAFRERVVLWPLENCAGRGLNEAFPLTCAVGAFLSPPVANPFAGGGCKVDREGGGGVAAIFLNVIRHSISSPANTVCSVQCTKTLMLVKGVDISLSWCR